MNTLLIVEDDHHIRQGLKKIISNMSLDISYIYVAEDGQEGLKIYNAKRPNIIMTDIRMPGMDGLDFIEQIKEREQNIKIIILSAYGDFSYAQRAIRYKVTDYLQKPVDKKELKNLLMTTIRTIEKEKTARIEKTERDKKLRDYNGMLFKNLLTLKNSTSKDIEEILNKSSIQWKNKLFVAGAIYLDNPTHIDKTKLIEQLSKFELLTYFFHHECVVIFLHSLDENQYEDYMKHLNHMIHYYMATKKEPLVFGLSDFAKGTGLSLLMEQCMVALDYKLILPNQFLIAFKDIKSNSGKPINGHLLENMIQSYKENNFMRFSNEYDELFNRITTAPDVTPDSIKYFLETLYNKCTDSFMDMNDYYLKASSLTMLKYNIKHLLYDQLSQAEINETTPLYNNNIQKALVYIEEHYRDNLTIDIMANYLDISPSYFSHLFKKEMGINFIDYLQKYRINQSKKLLLESNYKVYEIALYVGFVDDKYYYKIFKKYEGMTPSLYRKKRSVT